MSTFKTFEMDMKPRGRTLAPISLILDTTVDWPLEAKKDAETKDGPVVAVVTSLVDEYPDGGFAAWSVVFGVSALGISSSLGVY